MYIEENVIQNQGQLILELIRIINEGVVPSINNESVITVKGQVTFKKN